MTSVSVDKTTQNHCTPLRVEITNLEMELSKSHLRRFFVLVVYTLQFSYLMPTTHRTPYRQWKQLTKNLSPRFMLTARLKERLVSGGGWGQRDRVGVVIWLGGCWVW